MAPLAFPPGARDFDFLHGHWRIRNERLRERLVGAHDWETFEATLSVRPILGGFGNVDAFATEHWGGGFEGLCLRLFDPAEITWSEISPDSAR